MAAAEAAFWERLHELGWVEGRNLVIEQRSAGGRLEKLPQLMAEAIDRKVDVLVTRGVPGGIAAKKATSIVPIVEDTTPFGTAAFGKVSRRVSMTGSGRTETSATHAVRP